MSNKYPPLKPRTTMAEVEAFRAARKAQGRLINPKTCQVRKFWTNAIDHYNLFKPTDDAVSVYDLFVRNADDEEWVHCTDIPGAIDNVLNARISTPEFEQEYNKRGRARRLVAEMDPLESLFESIVKAVDDCDDLDDIDAFDLVEPKLKAFLAEYFPEDSFQTPASIAFMFIYFEQWRSKRGQWDRRAVALRRKSA
jgi:hypothetical protein